MKKSSSLNKLITIFLFLLVVLMPAASAYDADPIITYFTHTYIEVLSEATFYGGASDWADNAGMKKIVLYERGGSTWNAIYTKWCNTQATSCDLDFEVSKENAGSYSYRIRAWDKYNHASDYSTEIDVLYHGQNHAPHIIDVSPDVSFPDLFVPAEEGDTIQFSATAADSDGDTLTYKWKVDGTTVDTQSHDEGDASTISYTAPAVDNAQNEDETHTVSVFIYDPEGSADAWSWQVRVSDRTPNAQAGPDRTVDEGETVSFSANTESGSDTPWTYHWDFGDGGEADIQNPSHVYDTDGTDDVTFTVTLTITDHDGSSATDELEVTVEDITPEINSLTDDLAVDEGTEVTLQVDASVSYPDVDEIENYWWNFGDGSIEQGANDHTVSHVFDTDGEDSFNVVVRVYDEDNYATESITVTVNDVDPVVTLEDQTGTECANTSLTVSATPGHANDPIDRYVWNFGDGTSDETTNDGSTEHYYAEDGTYTLTVTVHDEDSETVQTADVVIADTAPNAEFSWNPVDPDEGELVQFNDTSVQTCDPIVNWTWDLDTDTSTAQNPTNTYYDEDTYTVFLTVTDDDGTDDTVNHTISVGNYIPTVTVNATPLTGMEPLDVNVTCNALNGNPPYDYDVTFGDGNSDNITDSASLSFTTSNTYAQNDTYTITCTVTDDDGDAVPQGIDVVVTDSAPDADFNWTPLNPSVFEDVNFTDISTAYDGIAGWEWELNNDGLFDDGTASSAIRQFFFPGIYYISLRVTDGDGTPDTQIHNITVGPVADNENPQVSDVDFRPDPVVYYADGSVHYGDRNGLFLADVFDNEDLVLPSVLADMVNPNSGQTISNMAPLQPDSCKFYVTETDTVYAIDDGSVESFSYDGYDYEIYLDDVFSSQCSFDVNRDSDSDSIDITSSTTAEILNLTISVLDLYESPGYEGLCRLYIEHNSTNITRWILDTETWTVPTVPEVNITITDVNQVDGCEVTVDGQTGVRVEEMGIGDRVTVDDVTIEVLDFVTDHYGLYYSTFFSYLEG
ncbi:PKD domain-containing protein, partial [Thermoproteota archaeon]